MMVFNKEGKEVEFGRSNNKIRENSLGAVTISKFTPTEVDGKCWFCGGSEGEMLFDTEFDTALHEQCLRNALEKDPDNREVQIMKYLLEEVEEIPLTPEDVEYAIKDSLLTETLNQNQETGIPIDLGERKEIKSDYLTEPCYVCGKDNYIFTMSSYRELPSEEPVGKICADCANK